MDINENFIVSKWYICNFKVYKDIKVICKVFKDVNENFPIFLLWIFGSGQMVYQIWFVYILDG